MHTCSSCGKTFDNCSKLERHANARTHCCPPTHHCDRCNKGFASYQTLWKHKEMYRGQPATHKINYPVGEKRSADISSASPNYMKDLMTMDFVKDPKITNLIVEILNDTSENQSGKTYGHTNLITCSDSD